MKMMKNKAFKTLSYSVFYEQAPEGGYVALVPVLPRCHTQGDTLKEAERNAKEATALYLESLEAHGIDSRGGAVISGESDCSRLIHGEASVCYSAEVIRALKRAGFVEDRQKGSHLMLIHPETKTRTVVRIRPGRAIEEPLLGAIVRDANLPAEEFIEEFETCPNWGANFPTYVLIRRFSARSLGQQRW